MPQALNIGALVLGIALGFAVGWGIGRRWEQRRRRMWLATAVVVAALCALGVAETGHARIELAFVGLLAGVLTGIRYGGFSEIRGVWRAPLARGAGRDDAPTSDEADASGADREQRD